MGGRAVRAHTDTRSADEVWSGITEVAMEAAVGAQFFTTVGAASLRGRDFTSADTHGAPRVAIVNRPLARLLYPNSDPLGRCVILPQHADTSGACTTIVGILDGVWYYTILNREKPMVYIPLAQQTGMWARRPGGMFLRSNGDPARLVEPVRQALQSVRSDLPAVRVTLLRDVVRRETRPWVAGATVFTLFGALALVVAVVGLYAVVSTITMQRSYELAVRLSLGARRRDIVAAVAGDTLMAVGVGLIVGVALAVTARRWLGPLLFQTNPSDPLVMAVATLVMFAVGALAVAAPVRRTLSLDTAAILRTS